MLERGTVRDDRKFARLSLYLRHINLQLHTDFSLKLLKHTGKVRGEELTQDFT